MPSARPSPLSLSVVTVFTAGVLSLQTWWLQQASPTVASADALACRLMCGLVCVILVLGGVIVVETVRRWYVLLANGTAAVGCRGEVAGVGVGMICGLESRPADGTYSLPGKILSPRLTRPFACC